MSRAPDELMEKLRAWLELAQEYLAWESWWRRRRARLFVQRMRTGRGRRLHAPR